MSEPAEPGDAGEGRTVPPGVGTPAADHRIPPLGFGPPPPSWSQPTGPAAFPPPWDPVSIIALVTSVLGWCLISIPLAIVGITRTTAGAYRGRGLAVAALVISVLWLVGPTLLVVVVVLLSATVDPGEPNRPFASLRAGNCIVRVPEQPAVPDVVSCTTPHRAQVFATFDQPVTDFSDPEGLHAAAQRACQQRLPATLTPLPESLSVQALGESAGRAEGERIVVCLAVTSGDNLRRSLPGLLDPLATDYGPGSGDQALSAQAVLQIHANPADGTPRDER